MVALLLGDNILTCSFPGCGGFAFQKGHKGTVILPFLTEVKKLEKRSRLLFYGSHTGPRKKNLLRCNHNVGIYKTSICSITVFTRPEFTLLFCTFSSFLLTTLSTKELLTVKYSPRLRKAPV